MPRFSIVMPCFNAAQTLPQTLASIAAQSFDDWELICIDDGATDATAEILAQHASRDPRIIVARNPAKGPSSARNHAAEVLASGEIIAFCDADDVWHQAKLADLDASFRRGTADVLFGQIGFFATDPDKLTTLSTVPAAPLDIATLLGENPVCTLSNVSIRRASFLRFGGFDTGIVHNEDLEWLIRLAGQGAEIRGIDRFHVWYRASLNGLSSDLVRMAAGRAHAIATAAGFGVTPLPRAEAVHHRYLARRALRLGLPRRTAARYALQGLLTSPRGFMSPPRRGAMTLTAALSNLFLPRAISRVLFS